MTETAFDPEELATARAEVSRALGSQLAEKASDSFCVATYRQRTRPAVSFGLETTTAGAAPAAATVIEFGEETPVPRLPRLTDHPDWSALSSGLKALEAATPESAPVRAPIVLRQALVAATRNESYQVVSPVYNEIERLSGSVLGPPPEVVGTPQVPTLVTQVCWLNRTIRTWSGPESLAEVAADTAVSGIDVPRRIMPEANTPNHRAIAFPAFFRQTQLTGANRTVAVIDSEVMLAHPALAGRVVHRRNYAAEPWGNPDSHGTAVAGIIAGADQRNGGLAPAAVIYNYKVLATNRFLNSDDFGGALAIQQALEDGADVANCSWGAGPIGPTPSREARAVDAAWALGLAVVKSAGNRGPGQATMTTPADADGIVVVGGTDVNGRDVQGYSSRGPANLKPGPDLVAPGGSAAVPISCCLLSGGFGDAGAGTSYAAPHVSGLLALYLEQDPNLVPDQLRERVVANAKELAGVGPEAQGAGLLSAR